MEESIIRHIEEKDIRELIILGKQLHEHGEYGWLPYSTEKVNQLFPESGKTWLTFSRIWKKLINLSQISGNSFFTPSLRDPKLLDFWFTKWNFKTN